MKHLAKVLALIMALALAFGLVACGHEHTAGSEWKSDKTNHWHTCTECDEVMDEAAHTPGEWQVDAESGEHYRVCTVCGYETDRAAHTPGEWQIDAESGEHYRVCSVCRYESDRAAHTSDNELHFNADYTQQWNECTVCGAEMNKTAHTHTADETEWESDGTNHWRNCSVCGQAVSDTQVAHTPGEWQIDAESGEHYRVCTVCGRETDRAAHTSDNELHFDTGYTQQWNECTVCGAQMNETAHTHSSDTWANTDPTNHWQVCDACGQTFGTAAHTPGEWQIDAEGGEHYRVCSVCGYESDRAAHTSDNELHFNADYTQQWNECTVCGAEMNKTAHTHTADETEWESDGTNHWRNCSVCGQAVSDTQVAHTPGEWQIDAESGEHYRVCTVCGRETDRAAHTSDNELHFDTGYTQQWNECTVCGAQMNETAHTHSSDTWVNTDPANHWQVCDACGQTFGTAAHTAGEWTYDAESGKDVKQCSVCGYQMDEREHVHAYTVWTNDGSGDTVSCICGEEYVMPVQKVYLDVQYTNSIVSENQTAQATVDLSAYEGISYTSAKLDDIDVTAQFADGTLTFGVAQFGLLYGEKTLVITVTDADEVTRTINVPVILVTKVFTDKAGFDTMAALSKECEADRADFYGGYFELGADIPYNAEMLNYIYPPTSPDAGESGFCGTFDGCGYTITGMQVNRWTAETPYTRYANCYGVFGKLAGGTVKNVSFEGAKLYFKGSLIASCGTGTIENVYISFAEVMINGEANRVGAFFSFSASDGATGRHVIVDLTNTVFKDYAQSQAVLDTIPANFVAFGCWAIRDGCYVIGAPSTYKPYYEPTASASDIMGVYENMAAFAEAYNATDSALKAEIDTWDTTYWLVTGGAISFVDKSAA